MVGEHIRARMHGRWIHAIDCGDETVIQLQVEAGPPTVRRCYRPEFVAGAEAVEVVTHRERTFPADEVVARAYSRIADPALAAMFRDSEAFAAWCATGRLPPGPTSLASAATAAAPDGAGGAAAPVAASRAKAARRRSPAKRIARAASAGRDTKRAARPGKARPARKPARKKERPARRTGARRRRR